MASAAYELDVKLATPSTFNAKCAQCDHVQSQVDQCMEMPGTALLPLPDTYEVHTLSHKIVAYWFPSSHRFCFLSDVFLERPSHKVTVRIACDEHTQPLLGEVGRFCPRRRRKASWLDASASAGIS